MDHCLVLSCGHSAALAHACTLLKANGIRMTQTPCDTVTHLLLPVPSFDANGCIKGGGNLDAVLAVLPKNISVIGGNLDLIPDSYRKIDLLKDPFYLAQNAAITAHCAIRIALNNLPCTLDDCSTLVIGWGRIGKCLARLLQQMDARVTVAARKATDRAALHSLGYKAISTENLDISPYRLVFNTAPCLILPDCDSPALKIDLASSPGITGKDVIWARGLPGRDAPESSGKLIAESILKLEVPV